MPVDSVEANTEPTVGIFGILSSVFGIFRYCKYRRRYPYRYFKISYIGSVLQYTDQRLLRIKTAATAAIAAYDDYCVWRRYDNENTIDM